MKTKRGGIGALMLYLTTQAAATFAAGAAAANEAQADNPAPGAERTTRTTRLVLADPTWDAFVFVGAATALALELSAAQEDEGQASAIMSFQGAEPQFDFLAALSDVGLAPPQADAPQAQDTWLA